jgi:hypothetical protein
MAQRWDSKTITIAESLEQREWNIMGNIERVPKSKAGFFVESELKRKKKLMDANVHEGLVILQGLGLVQQVDPSKKLWTATAQGKMVEHYISVTELQKSTGIKSIIRR